VKQVPAFVLIQAGEELIPRARMITLRAFPFLELEGDPLGINPDMGEMARRRPDVLGYLKCPCCGDRIAGLGRLAMDPTIEHGGQRKISDRRSPLDGTTMREWRNSLQFPSVESP